MGSLWAGANHTHAGHRADALRQSEGERRGQVGASDGEDRRHKERNTKRGAPFQAKLRQGSIYWSLLTLPGLHHRVGKIQRDGCLFPHQIDFIIQTLYGDI